MKRSPAHRLKRWCLPSVIVIALVLGGLLPFASATAQEATPGVSESAADSPLAAASAWLLARQDESGGFPGFSGELDPATTTDAVLALAAVQESDPEAAAALTAAIGYMEESGGAYAAIGPGQAAKLALAAVAGGRDPRDFAGLDLVAAMTAPLATPVPDGLTGIYGDDLYDHALVLLGLAAAGETVPESALDAVRAAQGTDGGWAFAGSTDPGAADSNTTSLVIQALSAIGSGDEAVVEDGLAFLASLQAPDGSGYAYGPADPLVADANSTALVAQALFAAGEDASAAEWGDPLSALTRFQTQDGGLRYMAGDEEANLLATLQGVPAMAGRPLPIARLCPEGESTGVDGCVVLAPAA